MEKQVALVIFDIGGYTEFIKYNTATLTHAHEVISQLLEDIVDKAEFPLMLNKFEGDAALMYADVGADPRAAVVDVSRQVFTLFPKFKSKVLELSTARSACPCGACQSIGKLRLKAIIHLGRAAFRKIRQFEEMGGEDFILLHRLLKNNVPHKEYVLASRPFASLMDEALLRQGSEVAEVYEHLGKVELVLFDLESSPSFSALPS